MGLFLDAFCARALAGELQLDALGERAVLHGIQEGVLVFFKGKAADINHLQGTLGVKVIGRGSGGPDAVFHDEAVGNEFQL